ncbi:MAG: ligase-associated DNA damage response DEXH box helicase [Saprospiraceae bacterium]
MGGLGYTKAIKWFDSKGWTPLPFQKETWDAFGEGYCGLVNAPTGSGKTYSLLIAVLIDFIDAHPTDYQVLSGNGLQLIWVTPIRALAKEIQLSCEKAIEGLNLQWKVETRTGDTSSKNRQNQLQYPPEILITTPESIHVLFATVGYSRFFSTVRCIVVDEWHELIGSKRGVQTELAISRSVHTNTPLRVWGISATIGNMEQAVDVLLYSIPEEKRKIIIADISKKIILQSVMPEEIETFPWAGHLGLKLIDSVIQILNQSQTTLIFTNTRAQCEIWYQKLIEIEPDLAGQVAMHHGSISKDIREWVEDALYEGTLKAVVCTSSLDLGVDFRPVDTIIQIGSPKGVARFVQRAGRSGHQPGSESRIWFVPTHALELVEAAGLRLAMETQALEDRIPYIRSFDVLIQYLMTLAVSEGFYPDQVVQEIKSTHCFASTNNDEWQKVLNFLIYGSESLQAYDEYKKVEIASDGRYFVSDKKKIFRHKLSIGTIVSEGMISIHLVSGKKLGVIEEWFVSQLTPGDVFWFAGRALELVRIKDMMAQVRPSQSNTGKVPSYQGGRLPLSSQMSNVLREKIYSYLDNNVTDVEIEALIPLFEMQSFRSSIPGRDELLVEYFESREGYHLLVYPFEGRNVHEGMAALLAKRISFHQPISFSIAMNDLGFELLSDQKIDVDQMITKEIFSPTHLKSDIQSSVNNLEMARRKFRDIARISGLIFSGFPGRQKKERHIQASSQLIFEVFREYEPDHLLYAQTFDEVLTFQLEESRMRSSLEKISASKIVISKPAKATPFSFPIIVDRMREKMSTEKLEDRIKKMTAELSK